MSWVTVIWSMIASACLTLAAIYALVWFRNRTAGPICSLPRRQPRPRRSRSVNCGMMRAGTPGELLTAMRWAHVALLFLLVSIIWFVHALPRCRAALARLDHLRPARVLPATHFPGRGRISTTARSRVCGASRFSENPSRSSTGITQSMDAGRPGDNVADPRLRRGCQCHGMAARRAPEGADGRRKYRVLSPRSGLL